MALQWAVNDSGNAARTQVVHTLARRMGLPFGTVREGLRTYAAKPGKLSYELVSEGGYLSLRSFAADHGAPASQREGAGRSQFSLRAKAREHVRSAATRPQCVGSHDQGRLRGFRSHISRASFRERSAR